MKFRIERFWSEDIKEIIGEINESLKQMDIEAVHRALNKLFDVINTDIDSKTRVSLSFVLEKIAQFDPFFNSIINFFIKLLEKEQDVHVKEFAVYISGNL